MTFEARIRACWAPPPDLNLSEWADENYYLSPESAAEPGPWRTIPYQRGVMNAISDPEIERVSWMKSSRVGATKILNATIGYYMDHDPCPIMVVQPTKEDAEGYSKEEIVPMLRDCPSLAELVGRPTERVSEQTILHKSFPGGLLSLVGANSARGFRRVSRRVVMFDEVDAYPASAGKEGDPIKLGERRTEYYANRKIIAVSTPVLAGSSRIERMFESGDKRRYFVPCPHCGHMDILVFRPREDGVGHVMRWPEDAPEEAYFECSGSGCVIEHHHKFEMLEGGEWRAEKEFDGHASFHIWAAYSLSPNAAWGIIAKEFVEAKRSKSVEDLQTFVNTVLGETWEEVGEAPDYERLYRRRETYMIGVVPADVVFLTAGVDVQLDRLIYEVVGWGADKQSWSVQIGQLFGDTADSKTWRQLDELVARQFITELGTTLPIATLAVDSGYNTQQVYNWARRYAMSQVIAVKGSATQRNLVGVPSPVDVLANGKRRQRGYKVWPVGVDIAKKELYGWLRLPPPKEDEDYPSGFCHFPEYPEEFFKQLTAEHLIAVRKPNGRKVREWRVQANRENHWLDTRVYARAAASVHGLDLMQPPSPSAPSKPSPGAGETRREGGWIGNKDSSRRRRRGGWLGGKR